MKTLKTYGTTSLQGIVSDSANNETPVSLPETRQMGMRIARGKIVDPLSLPNVRLQRALRIFIEGWNTAHFDESDVLTEPMAGDFDLMRPGEVISWDDYDFLRVEAYFGDPQNPLVSGVEFFTLVDYLRRRGGFHHLPPLGAELAPKNPEMDKKKDKAAAVKPGQERVAELVKAVDELREAEKSQIEDSTAFSSSPLEQERRMECTDMIFDALKEVALGNPYFFDNDVFSKMQAGSEGGSMRNLARSASEKLDQCLDAPEQQREEEVVLAGLRIIDQRDEIVSGAKKCALHHFPYWMEAAYKFSLLPGADFGFSMAGSTECSKLRIPKTGKK